MPRVFRVNSFKQKIGPYDANVLLSKPPWVFTSPNRNTIPFVEIQPTSLCARADGRFGLEDYVQVHQAHSEAYPWAPCILRKPSAEALETDPNWFLWEDITLEAWVHPPGASWQHTGVLRDDWRNVLQRTMQPIGARALASARNGTLPSYVSIAVNSLNATIARVSDLPMSYRDLVLQFTQAQRLGLDLIAMEAYHSCMFHRMIQRAKVYPLREEFLGCHTNNPTTVENMFYAGIPVVYVRPSHLLTPSQIRVRSVVENFAPVPEAIVTAHWPKKPCKVLHHGASSTRRFQMSRPHGRYFEDLIPLPDVPEPQPSMEPFFSEDPLTNHSILHSQPPDEQNLLPDFEANHMDASSGDFESLGDLAIQCPSGTHLSQRNPRKRSARGGSSRQPRKSDSRKAKHQLASEFAVRPIRHRLIKLITFPIRSRSCYHFKRRKPSPTIGSHKPGQMETLLLTFDAVDVL